MVEPGGKYRIRFASGTHVVYELASSSCCDEKCWKMLDKDGQVICVNPQLIETLRDVSGDPQYELTVGD